MDAAHEVPAAEALETPVVNAVPEVASETGAESSLHQEAARRKAERRWDAATFVPNVTSPVLYRVLSLQTDHAQKAFLAGFYRAQVGLYGIQVKIPIIGDDRMSKEIETLVAAKLDELKQLLGLGIARYRKVMEDNNDDIAIEYSAKPMRIERLPHYTPYSLSLSATFVMYDELCTMLDKMWYLGRCNSRELKGTVRQYRNKLLEVLRFIHQVYVRAKRAAASKEASASQARALQEHDQLLTDDAADDPVTTESLIGSDVKPKAKRSPRRTASSADGSEPLAAVA